MINILIVGASGRGKSTEVKQYAKKAQQSGKEVLIYDVNNEHRNGWKPTEKQTFEDFKKLAITKTNSVIVFEEATVFFGTRSNDKDLINLLVRKRHTNNTIVLLFHSLARVPLYVLEQCNYLILMKTKDRGSVVEKNYENFPEIVESFWELQHCSDIKTEKDFYEQRIILLN